MPGTSQQLIEVLEAFEALADEATPEAAYVDLDDTTLQLFWRDWPEISAWAGSLWRKVNQEMADLATPESDEVADTGGGG